MLAEWSQVARDILAQKYLHKPARLTPAAEEGVPSWLWRHTPDSAALATLPEAARYSGKSSARQVFDPHGGDLDLLGMEGRVLRHRGRRPCVLRRDPRDAGAPDRAPNSRQWFNTDLHWAYGIDGPAYG